MRGSAPHPAGTKLTVAADGASVGAVSGGCIEGQVIETAERVIEGAPAEILTFDAGIDDVIEQGLTCGGEIEILVERCDDPLQLKFASLAGNGERAALVSVIDSRGSVTGRVLISPDRKPHSSGELGAEALEQAIRAGEQNLWGTGSVLVEAGDQRLFVDLNSPATRLLIVGAVELARALCVVAIGLGWRVTVCDPRRRFATAERFPGAEVVAAWPSEAVFSAAGIDGSAAVAVLTHDQKIDDLALELALASPAAYVGALGSRRTQHKRQARLSERGISEELLSRLAAPIGLDIGATSTPEMALSIAAEIVAVLHQHQGGRLVSGSGQIHSASEANRI